MLVRSWAGFVAPACCVCWACSHGVGCLSGSPCAIRVRSRLRCCCGAVVVAVRGTDAPRGALCALCAPQTVYVYSCTLWLYCTLSALRRVLFRSWCLCHSKCGRGQSTEERRQPQRWAVRAAEGLEPCPARPWVPSYYARPIDIVQIPSIAPKRSRAMRWCDVRRILSTAHRRPRARVPRRRRTAKLICARARGPGRI